MKIIGIDFSLNSTGVTIMGGNTIKFGCFINSHKVTAKGIEKPILDTLDFHVIFTRKPNSVKKDAKDKLGELNRSHRETLVMSNYLADLMLTKLDEYLTPDTFLVLENYLTK